jgi:hypothetical protein
MNPFASLYHLRRAGQMNCQTRNAWHPHTWTKMEWPIFRFLFLPAS